MSQGHGAVDITRQKQTVSNASILSPQKDCHHQPEFISVVATNRPLNEHAGSRHRSCCGPLRFGLHNVNVSHAAQVLYGNLNAEIDGSDYLGDAAKYIKLYNQLQAELSSGAHP